MPDNLNVYLHLGKDSDECSGNVEAILTEFIRQVYPKLDYLINQVDLLVAAGPSGNQADIDAALAKVNALRARLDQSNTALDAKTQENK